MNIEVILGTTPILLFFSGLFSGFESAFLSIQPLSFYARLKTERHILSYQKLFDHKEGYLGMITILNNVVNIAITLEISFIVQHYFGNLSATLISTLVTTGILVIFGEIVPKMIGIRASFFMVHRFFWFMRICYFFTYLLVKILYKLLYWLFPSIRKDNLHQETRAFSQFLEHQEENREEEEEQYFEDMRNYLDLGKIRNVDIMIPKNMILGIPLHSTLKDVYEFLYYQKNILPHYIPVYEGSMNSCLGYICLEDILFQDPDLPVASFLHRLGFVYQHHYIQDTEKKLLQNQIHMAVVLDEFGVAQGYISLYTIMNEYMKYFGEGVPETKIDQWIKPQGKGYLVHADYPIEKFVEFLPMSISIKNIFTVGGIYLEYVRHFPQEGDSCLIDSYRWTVVKMKNTSIETLFIEKVDTSSAAQLTQEESSSQQKP